MDKAFTTALLIVIGMMMAMMLFNAAYPAVLQGGDAIVGMAHRASDQMDTDLRVVHVAGEIDANGMWQNTNANSEFEIFAWVKNIGSSRIVDLNNLDVFFGPEGNFSRIPYGGTSYPYWTWTVENGGDWTPGSTLRITVHYQMVIPQGRYFLKVGTNQGVSADYTVGF
jgi:hypothetical protein